MSLLDDFVKLTPEAQKALDTRARKYQAHQAFKQHQKLLSAFRILTTGYDYSIFKDVGIDLSTLNTYSEAYKQEYRLRCKTFTVCPDCYANLRTKPRKSMKDTSLVDYRCGICNSHSFVTYKGYFKRSNRKLHFSMDLRSAREYVYSNFPERFI